MRMLLCGLGLAVAVSVTGCGNTYTSRMNILGTCTYAKKADDLIKYCNEALSKDLDSYYAGPAHNARGLGHLLKKEYDLALADFNAAIDAQSYETVYYSNRGDAYLGKQDFDRAIEDYNRVLSEAPNWPEVYLHRGVAYLWKKEPRAAWNDFDTAVNLTGNAGASALMFRALAQFALRDYQGATSDLRKVSDLRPDSVGAEDGLCTTLAYAGRTYEALKHCERAAKLSKEPDGKLFARGYALLRNGDWKAALADCDQSASLSAIPAAALFCSAYAHERLGDGEAAKAGYAAARAADPEVEAAMKRLGLVPSRADITPEL